MNARGKKGLLVRFGILGVGAGGMMALAGLGALGDSFDVAGVVVGVLVAAVGAVLLARSRSL